MRTAIVLVAGLLFACPALSADADKITWKRTVVDKKFNSEGVAIGDFNKDGKMDVITGEVWYEAPTWKAHRIRPGKDDYTMGEQNVYSKSFACWTEDFDGDGWLDVLVIPFPGEACFWYENPQGKDGMWTEHRVWHSACNETPIYVDLLGKGKRVLVMGFQPPGKGNEGQMAYFKPGKNPTELWEMHPISEPSIPAKFDDNKKAIAGTGKEIPGTQRFSHGLGAGDINGDGRMDVMVTAGWWEQPEKPDGKSPWKFHRADFGAACADMYAVDLDGDGKNDVISSSAHNYGIWAYMQKSGKEGPSFLKRDLFPKLVSQTHAMHFVDINGDGLKDLVTGKRKWAHGPKGDADPNAAPTIYWFEAKKAADGVITFVPHLIDDDSGIGTQFTVADFNGDKLLDVIVANKHGVHVIEQVRR